MLHHNIDTKTGLVNSALGTVLFISYNLTILAGLNDVDRVQTKFMVLKIFYICRELNLAYAVTLHKYQGLSLDCNCQPLQQGL